VAAVDDLCRHLERWFPGRLEISIRRRLARCAVASWRSSLLDESGAAVRGLRADAHRAALAWLKNDGAIRLGSGEYDDLFAKTLFDGGFNAAEIRAGIQTLVNNHQAVEALIVTQYLDMTEQDGTVPTAAEVIYRLRVRGRGLIEGDVYDAILDFHQLLRQTQQPASD